MSQLGFEHQGAEVAANGAGTRQAIFRPQDDFGRESEDFAVNRRADYSGYIFVLGNKGPGYDNVESWLRATLRDALAGSVNLSAPHERACSATSARAWRVMRLRCLRKIAPSLDSFSSRRARAAYWRNAARTKAERLRRRADVSASSSKSFEVASSMAMVFIREIISGVGDYAIDFHLTPPLEAAILNGVSKGRASPLVANSIDFICMGSRPGRIVEPAKRDREIQSDGWPQRRGEAKDCFG